MKKQLNEKDDKDIWKAWFEEAKDMNLEAVPEFLRKLTEDYEHDYGTCVHAMTAALYGLGWALSREFGITGFQASAVAIEFVKHWNRYECFRFVDYKQLLYPQYADYYDKTISTETFDWLQKKAKKQIEEMESDGFGSSKVLDHMKAIVRGKVPHGFTVKDK
jgi:hypothetical protein